jgi:transcriptional regulator with XRE-family HTH domain
MKAQSGGLREVEIASDMRLLLRERYRAAKRRNRRFSLRSFARQLGIDHSTLSQVLRGTRPLSNRAIVALGKSIGLTEAALKACTEGRGAGVPARQMRAVRDFYLDVNTLQLLAAGYHYAILELIQLQSFKTDSRWIAHTLGISVEEVNIAIQRLVRLGLLQMKSPHRWIDRTGDAEFHAADLTDIARVE